MQIVMCVWGLNENNGNLPGVDEACFRDVLEPKLIDRPERQDNRKWSKSQVLRVMKFSYPYSCLKYFH
jgi:hypothetical protein